MKAWSFLVVAGRRQYAGNEGYSDNPSGVYRYDSTVGNSRHVKRGDLAIIRDTHGVLGMGIISDIDETDGQKQRNRCPVCGTTAIKKRNTKSPPYRCDQGHNFETPSAETITVTLYDARYASNWIPLAGTMNAKALRSVTHGAGTQNSIREVDGFQFAHRIAKLRLDSRPLLAKFLQGALPDDLDSHDNSSGYKPSFEDRRETILRSIKARRGQTKFRKDLIDRYGPRCVVSGCEILEIVEAAHVWPYRGEEDNAPSNGLLLRADIHTLFDLDLVGVVPDTWKIVVSPLLHGTEYDVFAGKVLVLKLAPSLEAIRLRWDAFRARAAQDAADVND